MGAWQRIFRANNLLSALGIMEGGLAANLLLRNCAKYPEATGGGLAANFSGKTVAKCHGANGSGLAANCLGGIFTKYSEANGGAWQRTYRGQVLLSALGLVGGLGSELFRDDFC